MTWGMKEEAKKKKTLNNQDFSGKYAALKMFKMNQSRIVIV